jgi:hypothetical protein
MNDATRNELKTEALRALAGYLKTGLVGLRTKALDRIRLLKPLAGTECSTYPVTLGCTAENEPTAGGPPPRPNPETPMLDLTARDYLYWLAIAVIGAVWLVFA